MNIKRFILSVILVLIVQAVIGGALGYFTEGYYDLSSGLWKEMDLNWMYMLQAFNLVVAFIFVLVYALIERGLRVQNKSGKGLLYGFIFFVIGGVPGLGMTYLTMNVDTILIFFWAFNGLLVYLSSGLITGIIYRRV